MISVPRVRWRLVLHILLGAVLYRFISHIWFPQFTSPMSSSTSPADVAAALLAEEGLQLQSLKVLQSLWAGYGHICHITATQQSKNPSAETSRSTSAANSNASTPQETQSFILKLIRPPPTKANDEGHTRKILSYQVEQYFYTHLAPQMPASLPVAKCLASINEHHANGSTTTAMILTDLRQEFPIPGEKREALTPVQAHAALDWLSGFHGFWWPRVKDLNRSSLVRPPLEEVQHDGQSATKKTIWLNGGYTYLATRRTEYAALSSDHTSEWSQPLTAWEDGTNSLSELIAAFLAPTTTGWSPTSGYQTLIHGDVKSENLFTSVSGEAVAFYDFQYVGLGLGVSDLAKFFTCSVPLHMLVSDVNNIPQVLAMQQPEKELLQRYWTRLKDVSKREYEWGVFVRHWETALVDWLRFQAGWGFWGNTEWLEARVRSVLKDEGWREGLVGNVRTLDLPEKDF